MGRLLAIAARLTADAKTGLGLPWPLRREEVEAFVTDGLVVHRVEQLTVPGRPDEPRRRAELRRQWWVDGGVRLSPTGRAGSRRQAGAP